MNFDELKKSLPMLKGREVQNGDSSYVYPEMTEIQDEIIPILEENGFTVKKHQSTRVDGSNTIVSIKIKIINYNLDSDVVEYESTNEVIVYNDRKLSLLQNVGSTITYITRMAIVYALDIRVEPIVVQDVQPTKKLPVLQGHGTEFNNVVEAVRKGKLIDDFRDVYDITEDVEKKINAKI